MVIRRDLSVLDCKSLAHWRESAAKWAAEHQVLVGVVEMAVGAAILAWGAQNGVIQLGVELVGCHSAGFDPAAIAGAGAGGGVGAIAGGIIGNIGVAGGFGAFGVPAAILAGGSSALLAAFGYTAGDIAGKIASEVEQQFPLVGASATLVGLALLLDGGRRVINDPGTREVISSFADGAIQLAESTADIIVTTLEELHAFARTMTWLPMDGTDAATTAGATVVGASAGGIVGASVAAASVTVLGSQTLGGAALAAGLVSAPLWPGVVAACGGALLGYVVWRVVAASRRKA